MLRRTVRFLHRTVSHAQDLMLRGKLTMTIRKILAVFITVFVQIAAAQSAPIDVARSTLTVSVEKAGFFSAFGHNHTIAAPIRSGAIDLEKRTVELTFAARDMKVTDEGVKDSERAEIERTMKSEKVLDVERFPEIHFHSTSVAEEGGHYRVRGELTLHGITRPIEMTVTSEAHVYRGSVTLKQTDFGITPVRVAAGAVRVKDEVKIRFEVLLSQR